MILQALSEKPSEIVTIFTDGALAIEALIFSVTIFHLRYSNGKNERIINDKIKNRINSNLIWWGATYLCLSLFALFGSISHGTTSVEVYNQFWPFVTIFGGLSLFFFQIGVNKLGNYDTTTDKLSGSVGSVGLVGSVGSAGVIKFIGENRSSIAIVIVYYIVLPFMKFSFAMFGVYLLIVFVQTMVLINGGHYKNKVGSDRAGSNRNESVRTESDRAGNPGNISRYEVHLKKTLTIFFTIILIVSVIQMLGSIFKWYLYFPLPDGSKWLFKPHNDIFHVVALYPLWILFKDLKNIK